MPNRSKDPTQTLGLRRRFAGKAYNRFRSLKGETRALLTERDYFNLRTNQEVPPPPPQAEDAEQAQQQENFQAWLEAAIAALILLPPAQQSLDSHWMGPYIRQGYVQGLERARRELVDAGFNVDGAQTQEDATTDQMMRQVLNTPEHREALNSQFQRALSEMKGITDTMKQQMVRELVNGLEQGLTPEQIANNINDRVNKVGIHRARILASTEVVRAHATAQLTEFERQGAEEVAGIAEVRFTTAGDRKVCPVCKSLEDQVFTITEAKGVIPVHPNCRCRWSVVK